MNFSAESPENYEQKCCCVLVLDVSGSMAGEAIQELNNGIQEFYKDIQNDSTTANRLEVAIVEFASEVKTLIDPSLVDNFTMPVLTSKGTTALVDGVREGIQIVRSRKEWYKQTGQPYYRPWIILITDGEPDPDQDLAGLSNEIQNALAKKEFHFFAIGVERANMAKLSQIADPSMPPANLQGLKFGEFFRWLSASLGSGGVTGSKDNDKISFPDPTAWMKGFVVS